MNENTADAPGTRVQVLVRAPHREVHVPVVQLQFHVTHCVGQVPTDFDSLDLLRVCCDRCDVKELARVVLDTGQAHERKRLGMLVNRRQNVLRAQVFLPWACPEHHQTHVRINAVVPALVHEGVAVRGERSRLEDNLVPLSGRTVERNQHIVEVHSQTVHHSNLVDLCANNWRHQRAQRQINVHPRGAFLVRVAEVRLNAAFGPCIQLSAEEGLGLLGHETERVSTHVVQRVLLRFPIRDIRGPHGLVRGDVKLIPRRAGELLVEFLGTNLGSYEHFEWWRAFLSKWTSQFPFSCHASYMQGRWPVFYAPERPMSDVFLTSPARVSVGSSDREEGPVVATEKGVRYGCCTMCEC